MQYSPQSATVSPHVGLGLGVQGAGLVSVSSASQRQPTILQQSSQLPLVSTGSKDGVWNFLKFFIPSLCVIDISFVIKQVLDMTMQKSSSRIC